MAVLTTISGVNTVINNLRRSRRVLGDRVSVGLRKGALFLQRKSQEIVPVDLNNLRPSAFTRNVGGKGFQTDMVVGYTADYAVYVHEDLEAKHKPGKKAKYLEGPAMEFKDDIIKVIAEESVGSKHTQRRI
jgi:hypothetical protein